MLLYVSWFLCYLNENKWCKWHDVCMVVDLTRSKKLVQCLNIFKSKTILSFCTKFGQCMGNLIRNMGNIFSNTLLFFVIYRLNPYSNPKKKKWKRLSEHQILSLVWRSTRLFCQNLKNRSFFIRVVSLIGMSV